MFTLNIKGRLHVFDSPLVMGILNITPDSFYEGHQHLSPEVLLEKAVHMVEDGASIIDLGGQSTRPGAESITAEVEAERVVPIIRLLAEKLPGIIISVDTFYASVAKDAVAAGAGIVNDVSGGLHDQTMIETVARLNVPFILMHRRGTAATMSTLTDYENLPADIMDYFTERINACRRAGMKDIIIDPGFGFAKNAEQNLNLLQYISYFKETGCPVMVGVSRKRTIYHSLGTDTAGALNGTTVLNTISVLNGANIVRVHDVKEATETIKLVQAYKKAIHS